MVVCEDGRMRSGEYRKFRVAARGDSASSATAAAGEPRRPCDDFAAMHEVVLRRYRALLEQGGPFPDLILIDGGKGQLSAAYAALEALGPREPGRRRHREEGRAARTRATATIRSRSPRTIRRCCSSSGSATRRIASP